MILGIQIFDSGLQYMGFLDCYFKVIFHLAKHVSRYKVFSRFAFMNKKHHLSGGIGLIMLCLKLLQIDLCIMHLRQKVDLDCSVKDFVSLTSDIR